MASLTRRLAAVEAGTAAPPAAGTPTIAVRQVPGTRKLEVDGSGFRHAVGYRVRIVVGAIGNETSVNGTTTATGAFAQVIPTEGVPVGTPIWISATDGTPSPGDLTGVRWSNTVLWTAT